MTCSPQRKTTDAFLQQVLHSVNESQRPPRHQRVSCGCPLFFEFGSRPRCRHACTQFLCRLTPGAPQQEWIQHFSDHHEHVITTISALSSHWAQQAGHASASGQGAAQCPLGCHVHTATSSRCPQAAHAPTSSVARPGCDAPTSQHSGLHRTTTRTHQSLAATVMNSLFHSKPSTPATSVLYTPSPSSTAPTAAANAQATQLHLARHHLADLQFAASLEHCLAEQAASQRTCPIPSCPAQQHGSDTSSWLQHMRHHHTRHIQLATKHTVALCKPVIRGDEAWVGRCPRLGCTVRCNSLESLLAHQAQYHTTELATTDFESLDLDEGATWLASITCPFPECAYRCKRQGRLEAHIRKHHHQDPLVISVLDVLTRMAWASKIRVLDEDVYTCPVHTTLPQIAAAAATSSTTTNTNTGSSSSSSSSTSAGRHRAAACSSDEGALQLTMTHGLHVNRHIGQEELTAHLHGHLEVVVSMLAFMRGQAAHASSMGCPVPGCVRTGFGWSHPEELYRHLLEHHGGLLLAAHHAACLLVNAAAGSGPELGCPLRCRSGELQFADDLSVLLHVMEHHGGEMTRMADKAAGAFSAAAWATSSAMPMAEATSAAPPCSMLPAQKPTAPPTPQAQAQLAAAVASSTGTPAEATSASLLTAPAAPKEATQGASGPPASLVNSSTSDGSVPVLAPVLVTAQTSNMQPQHQGGQAANEASPPAHQQTFSPSAAALSTQAEGTGRSLTSLQSPAKHTVAAQSEGAVGVQQEASFADYAVAPAQANNSSDKASKAPTAAAEPGSPLPSPVDSKSIDIISSATTPGTNESSPICEQMKTQGAPGG